MISLLRAILFAMGIFTGLAGVLVIFLSPLAFVVGVGSILTALFLVICGANIEKYIDKERLAEIENE